MSKVVVSVRLKTGGAMDVETPLEISADALIRSLHQALGLSGPLPAYIRCENPVAMLCGDVPLHFFGLHDGSTLYL